MENLKVAYLLYFQLKGINTTELSLLTETGKVKVLLFGIKKYKNILRQFTQLEFFLSYRKSNLITENVELIKPGFYLTKDYLFAALYVNELILEFLQVNDEIYILDLYEKTLIRLQNQENLEIVLREFEIEFLKLLGYELDFHHINHDFVLKFNLHPLYVEDIIKRNWNKNSLLEAKKILRQVINYYLNGKELKTKQLFIQNYKKRK